MNHLAKRVLRSLIKSSLRPYLLYELSIDQLSQAEGGLGLQNLELNPQAFNKFLPDSYHVVSGVLSISIDIQEIIDHGKLHVRLNDVDMSIEKGNLPRTSEEKVVDIIEEIQENFGTSIYAIDGLEKVAKDFQRMLHEMEISIQNLTLQLHSFSKVKNKQVYLVLQAPTVQITHIHTNTLAHASPDDITKAISFPNEFSLFLFDPKDSVKTMIADGALFEGIGSANLVPTNIQAILQQSPNSLHIRLNVAVRSFRGVLDPETLQTLIEIADLLPAPILNPEIPSENTKKNNDDEDYFSPSEFVDPETFESSSEEFFDFDDDDDGGPLNNSTLPDEMFVSFLPQTTTQVQQSTSFDISLTIKRATLTLLHEVNSEASSHVFFGNFDINQMQEVFPCTPYNHTTLFFADFSASIEESSDLLSCSLELPVCGITQYTVNPEKSEDDMKENFRDSPEHFWKTELLSFRQRCEDENSAPIVAKFVKKKILSSVAIVFDTSASLLFEEISFVIDDQLLGRFSPYLDILSSLGGAEEKKGSPVPEFSDDYETDIEHYSNKTSFHVLAKAISIRIQSSDPDALEGILLDFEEFDCSSSSFSHSIAQEWMISFHKFDLSLDRGYGNITSLFHTTKYNSRSQSIIPVRITFKPAEQPTSTTKTTQTAPDSPAFQMEDYNPETDPITLQIDSEEQNVSLPFCRTAKFFEGKQKNPVISSDEILDDFMLTATSQASMRIIVQLPQSSIDIRKENYDLLLQMISELSSDFNSNAPVSVDKPQRPSESIVVNKSSIVLEVILQNGTIKLPENSLSSLRESNLLEEEANSSFQGSFTNLRAFFVSNYNGSDCSYLSSSLELFELRDCAPALPKPLQIIQKPAFSKLDDRKMLASVIELSPLANTVIVELNNISIQYRLGSDWINRLQSFFTPQSPTDPVNLPDIPQVSDIEEQQQNIVFCNLKNITLDYLPYNPRKYKVACIFLVNEAEANLEPFTSSTSSYEFRLRSKPDLYVIDDTTKLCEIPEKQAYQLGRKEYITALGFRHIGEIQFLDVIVKLSNPTSGVPGIHLMMNDNRIKIHLCRDSYGELLKLYSDFSFFGVTGDSGNVTGDVVADEDEASFFDAVAPPPDGLDIHTIDDYDPSVQMTQLTLSTESDDISNDSQEILKQNNGGYISKSSEPSRDPDQRESARINPFDGEIDSPLDDVDFEDAGATAFDVPDYMDLDKTKNYVIYGVEDESYIPANAIRLDQPVPPKQPPQPIQTVQPTAKTQKKASSAPAVWDSDSDSEEDFQFGAVSKILTSGTTAPTPNITETKREAPEIQTEENFQFDSPIRDEIEQRINVPPPIRAIPARAESFVTMNNTRRTIKEVELDEFLLVEETKEQNPVVRIRNQLAENLKDQNENELPPMLGVTVQENYSRKRRIDNLLDLPDSFPLPSTRVSISGLTCTIILYDGLHWNSTRQSIVNEKNKIEIELAGLTLEFYLFNVTEKLDFRLGLEIRDLKILDKLEASNRNVLLCYDNFHLRSLGSSMVNVLLQQSTPVPGKPPHAMLNMFLLPLRLNIDQDARYFLTKFKEQEMPDFPASATLWEEIRISDIDLQLDYKAKRLERDPLNWCSLNNAKFRLKALVRKNVKEIGFVLDEYVNKHFWDVVLQYALGLGPLGPIVNLSKGVGNLFYQPYSHYQKNGRLLRGMRQGVTELGVTLASESLNIGSKVASGTQMVLQLTDDCLNMIRPESSKTQDDSRRYADHPANTVDGLQKGFDSVTRGANVAYRHLFVVPMEEYENHGTGGAVNALLHALPIAIIHPVIGIAEGAKQVGLGARNQLEPKETKDIYKT